MRMLYLLVMLTISSVASASAHAAEIIERRTVPAYVTSHAILPVSAQALREAVLKGLQPAGERSDPMYKTHGFVSGDGATPAQMLSAYAEDSANTLFSKEYFGNPEHANHIYVHFMGQPLISSYYSAKSKPLNYGVTFAIDIDQVNASESRVVIRTVTSHVFFGRELNVHAMGFVPKAREVPASPIDEYKLLVYVAHLVGVSMQPIE
jgi:hypothetical protein